MGGTEGDAHGSRPGPPRGRRRDHDLDHADYTDEHKEIADSGWWELENRSARRFVFCLHGRDGVRRYALIDTGRDWLLHLTKDQP